MRSEKSYNEDRLTLVNKFCKVLMYLDFCRGKGKRRKRKSLQKIEKVRTIMNTKRERRSQRAGKEIKRSHQNEQNRAKVNQSRIMSCCNKIVAFTRIEIAIKLIICI